MNKIDLFKHMSTDVKNGIVSASPNQIKKFYLGLRPKNFCKIPSVSTLDYY